jgi:uncharacterized SAM-binding protein YcdF (DUF218 family)
MVVASKLLWPLLQPDTLLLLWLALAVVLLWMPRWRLGRALATLGVAVLGAIATLPVGSWMSQPLESRFQPPDLPPQIDGIIVLGGNNRTGPARRLDDQANVSQRLHAFVDLARQYPAARLVYTGGVPPQFPDAETEAGEAKRILGALGVDLARITFEETARNTLENAQRTKVIVQPKPGESWVLVTSALHMPRAVAVFRAEDWPVIPYPVDLLSVSGAVQVGPQLALAGNLLRIGYAAHEWMGLIIYRMLGYTRELLPA